MGDGAWGGSAEQIGDERVGRRVEGAGRRAREKKKLRKKGERREARERERIGNVYLIGEEREL